MTFSAWLDAHWRTTSLPVRVASLNHGDLAAWLAVLDHVPRIQNPSTNFDAKIQVGSEHEVSHRAPIQAALAVLKPWRKGPWSLFGYEIDAEWRSDFKWSRFGSRIDWHDKTVLDVGCGNGYFGFRALDAGARSVLGVESFLLFVMQAALVNWFARSDNVVVPIRFGTDAIRWSFDIVLSLGVVYHQRDADQHVRDLFACCRPGGTVVLESIVADHDFVPDDRYARMRNVYYIPSVLTLQNKLEAAGFMDAALVNLSTTTVDEQRTTAYMPFNSLVDALDPNDPTRTIEGYPAPRRATFIAKKLA